MNMENELKTILESIDKNVFNDDLIKQISQIMESTIEQRVSERTDLVNETALNELDEKMTNKLNEYRESINKDHLAKIKLVVKTLNEDFKTKIITLKEKYDSVLKTVAEQHQNTLVDSVDQFLETYIDKHIPKEKIFEAAKNKYVENVLKEARQVLAIDPSMIKSNMVSAISDGQKQIQKLVSENAQLKRSQDRLERDRLLNEKCKNLPIEKVKWIKKVLEGKDTDYIKNNFSFVLEMHERKESKEKRSALETNKPVIVDRSALIGEKLELPPKIENLHVTESVDPNVNMYLEGLRHIA
jgi:hypothetical protein